ncbi:hypothetical protein [Haliangium sp.]|uniref:hypothetical protein n=1 Tax=Haliangium sp. TaxID=2663208 RepID=UPI003D0F8CA7
MRRLIVPILLAIAVLGTSVSACVVRTSPGHRHHHVNKRSHGVKKHPKQHKKPKRHKKHRKHKKRKY